MQFIFHIIISAIIFAILASGFKFFIKLKGNMDFSYMAIVIFASYIGSLANIHFGIGLLGSIGLSFVASIPFTFLIIFLSSRLSDIYFSIGTLALYIFVYQLAYNLESITGGSLGLSGMQRNIIGILQAPDLFSFLVLSLCMIVIVLGVLLYLKKTYFYKTLLGRGERDLLLKSFGISPFKYKLGMILITTFLASLAGCLYGFYYLYIDPSSFWFSMLILTSVVVFLSYKRNDIGTLLVSLGITTVYELLRFIKFVDVSKLGYFREIVFSIVIITVAFLVFRKINFGREN